jgi:O-antigen/teichoic acid export membrane protein
MDLLDLTVYLVGLFFGLRLGESLLYFYFNSDSENEKQRVVSTAVFGALLIGMIASAAGLVLAPQLSRLVLGDSQFVFYIRLTFITFIFAFPIEVGFAYLRAQKNAILFTTLTGLQTLFSSAIVVILLVGFDMKVEAFLWSNLVVSGAIAVYLGYRILSKIQISLDFPMLVKQLRYGAPLAVHGFGMLLIHYGDRFFLRQSVTLADIGIYALAYKIGLLISYMQTAFEQHWRAQAFNLLKRTDAHDIYTRTMTYVALVLTSSALAIVVFLDPALRLMVGQQFAGVSQYVPVLLAAYVIRAVGDIFRTVIRTEGRTHVEAKVTVYSSLSCLALYAALIPPFGLWGAVTATLLAFILMAWLSYRAAQQIKPFVFEFSRIVKIAVSALVTGAVSLLVQPVAIWQQIVLGIVLMGTYVALLWLLGFATLDEREAALRAFSMFRPRRRIQHPK